MKKQDAPDLETFAEQREQVKFAEHEPLARTIRVLRAELNTAKQQIDTVKASAADAERALSLYDHSYSERPEWLLPPKKAEPGRATLLTELSDIHAGETVRPSEMEGYNKFDLRICEMRLRLYFMRLIEMARSWSAYRWDGLVIADLGDKLSGGIHDELRETDECSPYEAAVWLVPRIAEGIELCRKEFKRVHYAEAPGNHGRDGKIPRYKGRAAHNLDTMIARLVAREFEHVDGVTFEIPDSINARFRIYDREFYVEHGEELARRYQGTAEIGALGPLMRGTLRTRNVMLGQGANLYCALWGHFHQWIPASSRGFISNGSVKGWDEYAKGIKAVPEPPQQALIAVTPTDGIKTQDRVILLDRKAEGW